MVQPRHRLAAYEHNFDWFRYWLQDVRDADARQGGPICPLGPSKVTAGGRRTPRLLHDWSHSSSAAISLIRICTSLFLQLSLAKDFSIASRSAMPSDTSRPLSNRSSSSGCSRSNARWNTPWRLPLFRRSMIEAGRSLLKASRATARSIPPRTHSHEGIARQSSMSG